MLSGVLGVLRSVEVVRVRHMGVVRGCFVVAIEMLLGGFVVMACSVLVVLRCLGVMMGCLTGHGSLLSLGVDLGYSTRRELLEMPRKREITAGRIGDEIP